jgi:hypothetical protein
MSSQINNATLTINVPSILKVRKISFFLQAKHIMGHFGGFFKGAQTFLTSKLSGSVA